MSNPFKCNLSTPQGNFFDATATAVIAPGLLGQFTILPKHEHIVAVLKKGVLLIREKEKDHYFVLDSGCLEVDGNHDVIILADKALQADNEADANQKVLTLEIPAV